MKHIKAKSCLFAAHLDNASFVILILHIWNLYERQRKVNLLIHLARWNKLLQKQHSDLNDFFRKVEQLKRHGIDAESLGS